MKLNKSVVVDKDRSSESTPNNKKHQNKDIIGPNSTDNKQFLEEKPYREHNKLHPRKG
jgi:hypothetical protein